MKVVGLVYVAFLLLSLAGMGLRNTPLQLAASAVGFVLAALLYRSFAPADPSVALALLPLAFVHYAIQTLGHVRADASMLRLALLPFGVYLAVLGYLIARSTFAPVGLGALVVLAGLAWSVTIVPGSPSGRRSPSSSSVSWLRSRSRPGCSWGRTARKRSAQHTRPLTRPSGHGIKPSS